MPACVDREHRAGAPEAGLHLVGDEQDAVLAQTGREPLQERGGRGDVAAFAEHRLDDDRRGLGRRGLRREQVVEPGAARGRPSASVSPSRERIGNGATKMPGRQRRVARRGSPSSTSSSPSSGACARGSCPENTITFGRPVTCLASFTAASVASAPEFA